MNWDKLGYHLKVSYWEGRLGNNIQQICCAIFIAEKTKSYVTYPGHDIMEDKTFDFREDRKTPPIKIVADTYFNYSKICGKFLQLYTPEEQRRICEKYIRPLFQSSILSQTKLSNKYKITNTDLVIHIRSGDNFIRKAPHGLYIQDPWSYYKIILDKYITKYKRIFVLTEPDKINPTIGMIGDYIQKLNIYNAQNFIGNNTNNLYEHIELTDLNTCIYILLHAKNIVLSNSSFAQRLCMCNPTVENIYASSLTLAEKGNNDKLKVHYFNLTNYIDFGEWKNTPEQIQKIIHHPGSDIQEISDINSDLVKLPPHFAKHLMQ